MFPPLSSNAHCIQLVQCRKETYEIQGYFAELLSVVNGPFDFGCFDIGQIMHIHVKFHILFSCFALTD